VGFIRPPDLDHKVCEALLWRKKYFDKGASQWGPLPPFFMAQYIGAQKRGFSPPLSPKKTLSRGVPKEALSGKTLGLAQKPPKVKKGHRFKPSKKPP